jgi:hypothetical protein
MKMTELPFQKENKSMRNISLVCLTLITSLLTNCSFKELKKSPFIFKDSDQGIELSENGKPVFFYQRTPKSLTGEYICSNYIHPLYSLNGDTLTEEFPADHPYHRGVFWTWHQLFADNVSLGDGWINDGISQDVITAKTEKESDRALISLDVMWKSSVFQKGKPFLHEHTVIIIHQLKSDLRRIDFEITLKPLISGLQIGGSADKKGYGGFCVRLKCPENLVFTSEKGRITPQELQTESGPWMDFSADFSGGRSDSGLTILCHPRNPNFPEPWILRQKGSMQNVVFPGQNKIFLPVDKPVFLRYRIIIHNGSAESLDIPELQSEYANTDPINNFK